MKHLKKANNLAMEFESFSINFTITVKLLETF